MKNKLRLTMAQTQKDKMRKAPRFRVMYTNNNHLSSKGRQYVVYGTMFLSTFNNTLFFKMKGLDEPWEIGSLPRLEEAKAELERRLEEHTEWMDVQRLFDEEE